MANNKEIIPVLDFNGQAIWRCGECGNELFAVSYTQADDDMKNHIQFCSHCGKKINWFRNLKGENNNVESK